MNILLVIETLHIGGAETFVVRLANELSKKGQKVGLVIFFSQLIDESLLKQVMPGIRVYIINIPQIYFLQKLDSLLYKAGIDKKIVYNIINRKLKDIISEFKADIVHSHLFKSDWVVSQIKVRETSSFRHVITVHGDYSAYYHGTTNSQMKNIRKKLALSLSTANAVVGICEEHLSFFRKHFPKVTDRKLAMIYNGYHPIDDKYKVRSKTSFGLNDEEFIFGMVSRGVEKKRLAKGH